MNQPKPRFRWRRVSHNNTLRHELRWGEMRVASVYWKQMDGYSWMPKEKQGAYWVVREGLNIPYKNTCDAPLCKTEEEAKSAALAYVKEHLPKS